ncbi:MAG: hypothetical protein CM15mP12_1560 [Gammaproteobacteria bacterium]|nr:MAG: hypothetical protein CM15mP12_1560 [Gammaproteobacteria bacterium]
MLAIRFKNFGGLWEVINSFRFGFGPPKINSNKCRVIKSQILRKRSTFRNPFKKHDALTTFCKGNG